MPVFEKQANTPVFEKQEESMSSVDIANYLRDKLPPMHAQYADAYAQAALNHQTIYLKPIEFALLHAGVIDRESKAGGLLRPRGPGGTGLSYPDPRLHRERGDTFCECHANFAAKCLCIHSEPARWPA